MPVIDLPAARAYRILTTGTRLDGDCMVWTGSATPDGYGRLEFNGSPTYAHRMSYELAKGPIPQGLEIDHLCRRPGCVNPHHLEAVTHRENMLRGSRATATECQRGHPFDAENTLTVRPKDEAPYRLCRACRNLRARQERQRKREAGK